MKQVQREAPVREFMEGERVLTMNFSSMNQCKWLPGVVVKRLGHTNYEVRLESGEKMHRHVDQLLPNEAKATESSIFERSAASVITDDVPVVERTFESVPVVREPASEGLTVMSPVADSPAAIDPAVVGLPAEEAVASSPVMVRRSARERRRPTHLGDYE